MSDEDPARVSVVSEQNQRSRRGGRPKYKPTDEHRDHVRKLVAEKKLTQREIAAAIGISPVTLRKAFGDELAEKIDQAGQLDFDNPQAEKAAELGRPEFEPMPWHRKDVKLCKVDGWSDERIARLLGISRNTLLKHFAEELEHGADLMRIEFLRNLAVAAGKGSKAAAEYMLNRPGMIAQLTPVDAPEESEPPAPKLGKKDQANQAAHTAHVGTSWANILKKKTTTTTMPN